MNSAPPQKLATPANVESFPLCARQPSYDEAVLDVGTLAGTLWRGKWAVLLTVFVAMTLGGGYAFFLATPTYRSTAVVKLETRQDQIVDLQSVVGGLTGDTSEIISEVEVLRARELMGKVVDKLSLVDDPEFNTTLLPQSGFDVLQQRAKAIWGLEKASAGLPAADKARRTRDVVVSTLLDKTSVRNLPKSLVFQVTVETESPEKSGLIADTIAELYIVDQIAVKFEATKQATSWLSDRVSELGADLETAESAVTEFSASMDLVSPEALQGLERQIKALRDRIASTGARLVQQRADLTALQTAASRAEKATLSNDPQLAQFLGPAQLDETLATAFDNRFERVLLRRKLDIERSEQQLAALQASKTELQRQIEQQGKDMITLQQMTRDAEATRLIYEYFLSRLKETSAQQGIQQADSRILSKAVVPIAAASPQKALILAMSGMIGLIGGAVLVLLTEARKTGFRTARDLERHTGCTVMGQIPEIPARSRDRILNYLTTKPASAVAEAIRNLRTSLMLSNLDTPPQVIVSTSSLPGEGKTTNSVALAHNLLGLGKSVLLVEGDIRRRTLHEYFKGMPETGLVSVLSGATSLEDAVFKAPGFGADVLGGEKTQVNAADLFASDKFKTFIADMRQRYDVILIDTPPILVVPDARLIAQVADAVLFAVKWDSTSRTQIDEALRLFHNSQQKVTGLVLSQISSKGMKRYGYGAYAGYGAKYYSD